MSNSHLHSHLAGLYVTIPAKNSFFRCLKCRHTWNFIFKFYRWYFISKQTGCSSRLDLPPAQPQPPFFNKRSRHTAPHFESSLITFVRKPLFLICESARLQRYRRTFQNTRYCASDSRSGLIADQARCPQTATKTEPGENGDWRTFNTSKLLSLLYC